MTRHRPCPPAGLATAAALAAALCGCAGARVSPVEAPVSIPAFASLPTAPAAAAVEAVLPPERRTTWHPGRNAVGGIPSAGWPTCERLEPRRGDAGPELQRVLDGCRPGSVVRLAAGTFRLGATLRVPSGVVLRGAGGPGAGEGATRLVAIQPGAYTLVALDPGVEGFTELTALAADAVKGTRAARHSGPRRLAPGELVLVDQRHDPGITWWGDEDRGPGGANRGWFTRGPGRQGEPEGRPTGQVLEVASVRGTEVTFTTPFHLTYSTERGAQLCRLSSDASGRGPVLAPHRGAGVEDLVLEDGGGGDGGTLRLAWTGYSWVRNVETVRTRGSAVALTGAFRSEVRDSFLHSTVDPNPGGGGYGLALNWHAADNLAENNAIWNFNKVLVLRASGGGNVIAYNALEDGWIGYAPSFVETGLDASHAATPLYELFEGNQAFNFDADSTHGNAIHVTAFRNHLTGLRRALGPLAAYRHGGLVYEDAQNRRAVGLMTANRWFTFAGNVLGLPGQRVERTRSAGTGTARGIVYGTGQEDAPWLRGLAAMWKLGYNNAVWRSPPDAEVVSTTLRDGNFDHVTGTVRWDREPRPLPPSLYLAAKPAFFGDRPWPWVEPLAEPRTHRLPARERLDALLGVGR